MSSRSCVVVRHPCRRASRPNRPFRNRAQHTCTGSVGSSRLLSRPTAVTAVGSLSQHRCIDARRRHHARPNHGPSSKSASHIRRSSPLMRRPAARASALSLREPSSNGHRRMVSAEQVIVEQSNGHRRTVSAEHVTVEQSNGRRRPSSSAVVVVVVCDRRWRAVTLSSAVRRIVEGENNNARAARGASPDESANVPVDALPEAWLARRRAAASAFGGCRRGRGREGEREGPREGERGAARGDSGLEQGSARWWVVVDPQRQATTERDTGEVATATTRGDREERGQTTGGAPRGRRRPRNATVTS